MNLLAHACGFDADKRLQIIATWENYFLFQRPHFIIRFEKWGTWLMFAGNWQLWNAMSKTSRYICASICSPGVKGLHGPPRLRPPPQVSRKKGGGQGLWPRQPTQTCWVFNEISKMEGGLSRSEAQVAPLQTGCIVFCEIFNSIAPNLVFVFFLLFLFLCVFFFFFFICVCEQMDAIVVFWRFGTVLLKTSISTCLRRRAGWTFGLGPLFLRDICGAPEGGGAQAVEACNTGIAWD